MAKHFEFIFDFASPNAYLVHHALPDFLARNAASVTYTPCLLGGIFKSTNNQAPMIAFGEIPAKLAYDQLEIERFLAKYKLDKFQMNPHFPVNTVMVMRGACAAEMDGYLMAYIDAMLVAMWETGEKLDDPEVLHKAWAEAGFDADKLAEQITTEPVKAKLLENSNNAVARGCFGIPTFFVGDDMLFGKERLGQLAEML